MLHDKRSALSGHVSSLLTSGRTVFTAEEAERGLGVGRGAFLDAADRLQRRKALLSPRSGDSMSSSRRSMRPGGRRYRPGTSKRPCAARVSPNASVSSRPRSCTVRRTRRSWSFRSSRTSAFRRSARAET